MHQYSLTKNNDILKLTSLFIIKLLHFTHLGQLFIIWLLNMQLPDTASPEWNFKGILSVYRPNQLNCNDYIHSQSHTTP